MNNARNIWVNQVSALLHLTALHLLCIWFPHRKHREINESVRFFPEHATPIFLFFFIPIVWVLNMSCHNSVHVSEHVAQNESLQTCQNLCEFLRLLKKTYLSFITFLYSLTHLFISFTKLALNAARGTCRRESRASPLQKVKPT